MDDKAAIMGPPLPLWALMPAVMFLFVSLIYLAQQSRSHAGGFLITAIGARPLLSSMHAVTFTASPLGLSWNALVSIAVVVWGTFLLHRRRSVAILAVLLVPLIFVAVLSGVYNQQTSALASYIVKYAYLAILTLIVVEACEELGSAKLCRFLVFPLTIPLIMQIIAFPLGVVKAGELDGSASYIGGFYHEAAFSTLLLATALVIAFAQLRPLFKTGLIGWCVVGILAANYRTALLAVVPLISVLAISGISNKFVRSQRAFALGVIVLFTVVVGIAIASTQQERFADLSILFSEGLSLIKRPELFNVADRHVMSARPLIWSQYIYGWQDAGPVQHWIGLGPEAWVGQMRVYAHNTLVSALYEVGILGVAATLVFWVGMFMLASRAPSRDRPLMLASHLSFLILNMATMPMWMIEGMIYYSVLCGITLYYATLARDGTLERSRRDSGVLSPRAIARARVVT